MLLQLCHPFCGVVIDTDVLLPQKRRAAQQERATVGTNSHAQPDQNFAFLVRRYRDVALCGGSDDGFGQAEAAVRSRFIAHYLGLAELFERDPTTNQAGQYQRLRREHANLRAAMRATLAAHADGEPDPMWYLRDALNAPETATRATVVASDERTRRAA